MILVQEKPKLDAKGLPQVGPYDKVNPAVLYPIMYVVAYGLGTLFAWGIYSLTDHALADQKVAALSAGNLQWLYLAVLVMGLVLGFQQVFVAYHRKLARVENPDQYIFKTMLKDDAYIRLEMDGPVGAFNRAQRGIDNTREDFVVKFISLIFAGYVFPEVSFILAVVVLLARVLFSYGYIYKSRMTGQMLSMIASIVVNGLLIWTVVLAFKHEPPAVASK